jgi:dihydroxy-acid dehydratase
MGPEALDRGPIAIAQDGDLVLIDIPNRRIDIVGTDGIERNQSEITEIIRHRMDRLVLPVITHTGVLGQYTRLARPALEGASCSSGRI